MGKAKKLLFDWVIPIVAALILTFLINKFLLFQVSVPTGSMIPTIEKDDRLLITKVYNYSSIKRGDILVFNSREYNQPFVKRVVGLPGEKVEVVDGVVYINGTELKEDYVKNPDKMSCNFGVIPQGHYLFLGDNRAISEDARYWKNKFIDEKDIMGKARFTVYPFSRFGSLK